VRNGWCGGGKAADIRLDAPLRHPRMFDYVVYTALRDKEAR
jgi:hypothetical protein